MSDTKCTVYRGRCKEHGFIHGREAEELRKGIEKLIENIGDSPVDSDRIANDLQRLLDRVDARDSLAYLEARKRPKRPDGVEQERGQR